MHVPPCCVLSRVVEHENDPDIEQPLLITQVCATCFLLAAPGPMLSLCCRAAAALPGCQHAQVHLRGCSAQDLLQLSMLLCMLSSCCAVSMHYVWPFLPEQATQDAQNLLTPEERKAKAMELIRAAKV